MKARGGQSRSRRRSRSASADRRRLFPEQAQTPGHRQRRRHRDDSATGIGFNRLKDAFDRSSHPVPHKSRRRNPRTGGRSRSRASRSPTSLGHNRCLSVDVHQGRRKQGPFPRSTWRRRRSVKPRHSRETLMMPGPIMPSARAALIETSMTRPRTKGPRSLTRQRIEWPSCETVTMLPIGRVRWAHVISPRAPWPG